MNNPVSGVKKADEKVDRRRERRALTEDELQRLLEVARHRPLLEAMTVRHGKNKGEAVAKLREETRLRLDALGRERALIYKTLVLTGLRKKELTTLTVGQLALDGPVAFASLKAGNEKNRQGSEIALRSDLADDLRHWLADKRKTVRGERSGRHECLPMIAEPPSLPANTLVFRVPRDLVRILDRDLKRAGISKVDDRGRTVDVHALRTSFGTLLSKGGVAPRTAQAAMRHSTIDLTMNTYTDPKLLDVHAALDALPTLSLEPDVPARQFVTGTDGLAEFAPGFAPKADKPGITGSSADKTATQGEASAEEAAHVVSPIPDKQKQPLTKVVNGLQQERETGFEPATSSLGS